MICETDTSSWHHDRAGKSGIHRFNSGDRMVKPKSSARQSLLVRALLTKALAAGLQTAALAFSNPVGWVDQPVGSILNSLTTFSRTIGAARRSNSRK